MSFANLPIWEYMDSRPIASIEQFPYKQGEKATEILFSVLEGDDSMDEETETPENQVIFDSEMRLHF
ncbi:hypothetical protein D3C87_2040860 [compost metagenome]